MRAPAWLLVVLGLVMGLSGCAHSLFQPRGPGAESHRVQTADGWDVSLIRYPPQGASTGRPVLLCHGISANDRNFDLDAEHSLARWLSAQGRETWVVSLRGTGESDRADAAAGRDPVYDFDAYWQQDLPAVLKFIRARHADETVDYVGHSMGGMIAYAFLSQGGEGLHAVVTLASPTRLDLGSTVTPKLLGLRGMYLKTNMQVAVVAAAHSFMPLHGRFEWDPFQLMMTTPENTTAQSWRRLLAYSTADIAGGTALQLLENVERGFFGSRDGRRDYRAGLAQVHIPVLVVAGKGDRIAPPPAVKDGYWALGGPKRWLLVGVETGAQADYGHMDFVMGERAAMEVWAPLLAFLNQPAATRAP